MPISSYFRVRTTVLAAVVIAGSASPALAASAPSTRLVACEAGSCLLLTGRRANPASAISINGHVVPVTGKHNWRASLPVETVRLWSAPFARRINVATFDSKTGNETTADTALPIGLLGHVESLAMLVITAK
jgi:hypothetical protein